MLKNFLITLLINYSLQASTPNSLTYEAGVVEFNYENPDNLTGIARTDKNLKEYLKIINDAPATLDVIVFPEMTLNGMETAVEIPEPKENISPCVSENYSAENLVKQLSCAAKNCAFYIVVNIVTKAKCPDAEMLENKDPRKCTDRSDGFSYYNTNVVFDRNGTVISRYRKFNLFGEPVDKPFLPELSTFETDFGVKFGHFVCFDIAFRKPAVELVRTEKVTDIIFPTMWFSEFPFLTAVQVQQNWAHSLNVNFLAAGANYPRQGSSGTGIYAGRKGPIVSTMSPSKTTKLYTATVPKLGNNDYKFEHNVETFDKNQMKSLYLKRDQLDVYTIKFLESTEGNHTVQEKLSSNGISCDFDIKYEFKNAQSKKHYEYAMGAYHGKRTFDGFADGGVVVCAILACQEKDVKTCGIRNEELEILFKWEKVEISGTFPTTDGQFFYLPTSLDTSVFPLMPERFDYESKVESNTEKIKMSLKENADLYTFGIYGRDFNLDDNAGNKWLANISLLVFSLIATFFAKYL